MESIIVYVWPRHDSFVGHSSMQLSNDTYISFWPRDPTGVTNPSSPPMLGEDLAEDISNEGGIGPKSFVIQANTDTLDKIRAWWIRFQTSNYNFISNNCSTAVFLGLRAGFPFLQCLDDKLTAWVPEAAGMLAQGIPRGQGYFDQRTIQAIIEKAKCEAVDLAKDKKGGGFKGAKAGHIVKKKF